MDAAPSMCHEHTSLEQVRCALGDLGSDLTEIGFVVQFLRDETEAAPTRDRLNTHQRLLIDALSSRLATFMSDLERLEDAVR